MKINRRQTIQSLAGGGLILPGLISDLMAAGGNPLASRRPHFEPKAKRVIFMFMTGGVSHMDTFEYKPELYPLDGKTIKVKTFGRGGKKDGAAAAGPSRAAESFNKLQDATRGRAVSLSRRVQGDLLALMKGDAHKRGMHVSLADEDRLDAWRVKYTTFPDGSQLALDLAA